MRDIMELDKETVDWVKNEVADKLNTELMELKKITGILYHLAQSLYFSYIF